MDWDSNYIRNFVAAALEEAGAASDSARRAIFLTPLEVQAWVLAQDDLVCAGLPLAERIFRTAAPGAQIAPLAQEGQEVRHNDSVLQLRGDAGAILGVERTALNVLEHLSGIATKTRRFVENARGTRTKICGPREATPGMRALEQYAIELGGGTAHRTNNILLTTNHVRLAGGVKAALDQAHSQIALQMQWQAMTAYEAVGDKPNVSDADALVIQIEVQDEGELREALNAGAAFVILKSVDLEEVRRSVQLVRDIRPEVIVEISGDITLSNVRAYAETGADYVGCEELIHPTPGARFDLLVERREEK